MNKKVLVILSGIKVVGIGMICGLLGAWAGADGTSKNWRRLLIPAILTVSALLVLHNLYCLSILVMAGALSLGYGIPEPIYNNEHQIVGYSDDGSDIGGFWYDVCEGDMLITNYLTRGTVGLLVCISLSSIPFIKQNWITYLLCSAVIMTVYVTLSWRSIGCFKFRGKNLTWAEGVTYTTLGLMASIIIWF